MRSVSLFLFCVQILLYFLDSTHKWICLGVGLLAHMATLFSVSKGTSTWLSTVAAPIYLPPNSVGGFPFLHTPFSIYYL